MISLKLTEDERTSLSNFRNVSDLRIQYLCEYRFYLQEKFGQKDSRASIDGSRLHDNVAFRMDKVPDTRNQLIPTVIIVLAIIIGFLWIFG